MIIKLHERYKCKSKLIEKVINNKGWKIKIVDDQVVSNNIDQDFIDYFCGWEQTYSPTTTWKRLKPNVKPFYVIGVMIQ